MTRNTVSQVLSVKLSCKGNQITITGNGSKRVPTVAARNVQNFHLRYIKGVFDWQFKTCQILKMVDFAGTETQFPIKHKILQSSRFQIQPGESEVSSWQTRRWVWCLATTNKVADFHRSNARIFASFESFANENENLSKVCQTFGAQKV